MRENRESREQGLVSAIVKEAVALAPRYDLSRGSGHIWQALKNVGIRQKGEQAQWFGKVKKEVDRRVQELDDLKEIREREAIEDSEVHERAIDPKSHDEYSDAA